MAFTQAQIKGKIKSIAAKYNADARLLMRIYMMDRFLERLALSPYRDNFIIKGGILVTSMVGVAMRSTMDIDASIKNLNLNAEDIRKIVTEIAEIPLDDGVSFVVKRVSNIMDNFEYPGIRLELNALMGGMITPIKIDISTGDIVTPREINYSYHLMIDNRNINLWTYNLKTILAEKLQTILARDVYNTRMRDFYDVFMLMKLYDDDIDEQVLSTAFKATCQKRNSAFENVSHQLEKLSGSVEMQNLWKQYQSKYLYATDISFESAMDGVKALTQKAHIN